MPTHHSQAARLTILALSALLTSTCALADKGGKHGHGNKHGDDDRAGPADGDGAETAI